MSTAAIIVIVVVAIVIVGVIVALASPRARVRRRERELHERRDRAAGQHREQAGVRNERAEAAQTRAQVAEAEAERARADAERERAEAQLHEAHANVHEQGLADHELVEPHERERFAGTAAADAPVEDADEQRGRAQDDREPASRNGAGLEGRNGSRDGTEPAVESQQAGQAPSQTR